MYCCNCSLSLSLFEKEMVNTIFELNCRRCGKKFKTNVIYRDICFDCFPLIDQQEKHRFCFDCGKELEISEFLKNNLGADPQYLLKIWLSKEIELYCCACYKKEKTKEQIEPDIKFNNGTKVTAILKDDIFYFVRR